MSAGAMALWRGLRCCRRALAWLPVLLIALLLLWSYYGYVCELCLGVPGVSRCSRCVQVFPVCPDVPVTVSNPVEKVAYLVIFHILFVLFVWTYWKSVFTLPVQPDKKFHMSYADQERYENEERPEVQRQILAEIARKLPVYTRTGNGEAFSAPVFQNGPDKNGFNLGFVKNLQQVFGEEKKLWLLPIASSQGDGHFFPMRASCEARNPLLANEEQWEEDGIDEEPQGSGETSALVIERET
ncbi:hypothetical protein BTVI_37539 [Pitangus sulphuratus]|nr:hypothetical protein BTVI_37539 [Pitangus sulphuratus]